MTTLYAFRAYDSVSRVELVKMFTQFATIELGMIPDYSKDCSKFMPSLKDVSEDLQDFAILGCQLNIMGIHPDGKPLKNFNPF
jgi:hypothetical protein